MRTWSRVLVGFVASLTFVAAFAGELRAPLPEVLARAAADELVPVSVVLRDQATTGELQNLKLGLTTAAARRAVTGHLRARAERAQAGLLTRLRLAEKDGAVARLRPLWIGNVVGVDATPAVIHEIAARPEVAWVNHNPKVDVFLGGPACQDLPARFAPGYLDGPQPDEIECGVQKMRAPEVWNDLGVNGAGAVVAVVDTGVCHTHPDIANNMWVNPGEDLDHDGVVMDADDVNGVDDDANGYVDDFIGWDFDNGDREPNDDNSHGSHCAGTVAGDGTSGTQTGVAPGASIMAVKVGVTFADEVDVWNGMQYAADNGADAISMSLGWPHGQNPDRATWRTNCENTIEAGTIMVIAAGNEGSGAEPDNVRTPGDVPRVITVGATDCADTIAGFSSRGPITWQGVAPYNDHPYPPGLVKPDVSAPGVDTKSNNVCSGYSFKSGTSMATPHVAGAVALIRASSPGLPHDDVKVLLEETSVDLGPAGKDNEYGSGRVDAFEAVSNASTSDGRASIKEGVTSCSAVISVSVSDGDLRGAGTLAVLVTSTSEPGGETASLTETSVGSGIFKGTIGTSGAAPAADGLVQVADGDVATVTYIDADDGEGGHGVPKSDVVRIDCAGPEIAGVTVDTITNARATVRFTTAEPGDTTVEWGMTPALGQTTGNGALVTAHAIVLNQFDTCQKVYLRVSSRDQFGNRRVESFVASFQTATIPGLYYRATFENGAPGWTLQGEWEVGAPRGLGAGLNPDPASAYNNNAILGHDLTGRGANPGSYEPNVSENARMPSVSASTWTNTRMIYYRKLNTQAADEASLWIWSNGAARPLYRNDGQQVAETDYTPVVLDIGQIADHSSTLYVEFRQRSDGTSHASGWNVDELVFKDGTLPDYGACGSCGAAPSFAGASSARDLDACAPTGVTVSWPAAVAWGSAWSGTYSLYRDVAPGFTPSAANRIATGLTALSYTDTAIPPGATRYYLVRAENAETCSTGPNNGGVVDGNTSYAAVTESTSQSAPAPIAGLDVSLVGRVHVRLSWPAAGGATSYSVSRSATPQAAGFTSIGSTSGLLYEDLGAGATGDVWFYLVRGVNACGQ